MDWISLNKLRELALANEGPRVSIYMPTHRAGPQTRQDPIRLKNLLRLAEDELVAQGMRGTLARDFLKPGHDLVDDYDFWQQQSDALAVFATEDRFRYYRLPLDVPELAVVSERFHLKPILPLFSEDGVFYLLAISMGDIRVFRCTRHSEEELKVEGVPRNMAAALWPDDDEKQLQFRTIPAGQAGGEAALFHGTGAADRDVKVDILRYFQRVDHGMRNLLHDQRAPLVLAAVDYLHPIYREANSYAYLLDQAVVGNPDEERADALRSRAWEVVGPHFEEARKAAIERFNNLTGTGKSVTDPAQVASAASEGRVETLFVAVGVQRWGRPSEDGRGVELHDERQPGDQDVLDFAAVQTLLNAGSVYALPPDEVPNGSPLAAVYRY
jgi:hypothetical protein